MRIAVSVQFNEAFREVKDITFPVLEEYCERHGYEIILTWIDEPKRSIIWDRYSIIAENLKDYDYIVHMDCDVLITNLSIRLEEFCQGPIVIAQCLTESGEKRFNDGVAFFKNCFSTHGILRDIQEMPDDDFVKCGQDALEVIWRTCPYLFRIERQKAINAMPFAKYGMPEGWLGNWSEGDFVLHLPGMRNDVRCQIFREILPKVLR